MKQVLKISASAKRRYDVLTQWRWNVRFPLARDVPAENEQQYIPLVSASIGDSFEVFILIRARFRITPLNSCLFPANVREVAGPP